MSIYNYREVGKGRHQHAELSAWMRLRIADVVPTIHATVPRRTTDKYGVRSFHEVMRKADTYTKGGITNMMMLLAKAPTRAKKSPKEGMEIATMAESSTSRVR